MTDQYAMTPMKTFGKYNSLQMQSKIQKLTLYFTSSWFRKCHESHLTSDLDWHTHTHTRTRTHNSSFHWCLGTHDALHSGNKHQCNDSPHSAPQLCSLHQRKSWLIKTHCLKAIHRGIEIIDILTCWTRKVNYLFSWQSRNELPKRLCWIRIGAYAESHNAAHNLT